MHECLIYILFDQNGIVDYVGRTARKDIRLRIGEHRRVLGYLPKYAIVDRCSTDCRKVERRWIEHYRNLGCQLRNISYGQGPHFCSDSTRTKLSEAFTGRPVTWGEKISASQRGIAKEWSAEGRVRVVATQFKQGHNRFAELSDKERQKIRECARNLWRDPQKRARMSKAHVTNVWPSLTPEQRAERGRKISAGQRNSPLVKSAARRGGMALQRKDPLAASRRAKKFWADLRKDPELYREYIERRTRAIVLAKGAKKADQ